MVRGGLEKSLGGLETGKKKLGEIKMQIGVIKTNKAGGKSEKM